MLSVCSLKLIAGPTYDYGGVPSSGAYLQSLQSLVLEYQWSPKSTVSQLQMGGCQGLTRILITSMIIDIPFK